MKRILTIMAQRGVLACLCLASVSGQAATTSPTLILQSANQNYRQLFGESVAVSGVTMVVGVPGDSSTAAGIDGDPDATSGATIRSGAAYVFIREGTNWIRKTYLKAANPRAGDAFGTAVDIDGDIIAISALRADLSIGAVYVFVRTGDTWMQETILRPTAGDRWDGFGTFLSLSAGTLVIGSPGEDSGATTINGVETDNSRTDSGAAFVYVRNGTTWSQQAYLKPSDATAADGYGAQVDIEGDTVAVHSRLGTKLNVYRRDGVTWSEQLFHEGPDRRVVGAVKLAGDFLAVAGESFEPHFTQGLDPNRRGPIPTVLTYERIGDEWHPHGLAQSIPTRILAFDGDRLLTGVETIHSFVRRGTNWLLNSAIPLPPADPLLYEHFGTSLAFADDTIVVSGAYQTNFPSFPGRVYLYDIPTNAAPTNSISVFGKGQEIINGDLTPSRDDGTDFGHMVTDFGHYDDGFYSTNWFTITNHGAETIRICGPVVPREQPLFRVRQLPTNSLPPGQSTTFAITFEPEFPGLETRHEPSQFGPREGLISFTIGESLEPFFFRVAGIADPRPHLPELHAYLKAPDSAGADAFGVSVAMTDNTVVIGRIGGAIFPPTPERLDFFGDDATNQGAAFVYVRGDRHTNWVFQAKLEPSHGAPDDLFGSAVAISDNTVVVGAPQEDGGEAGINGDQTSDELPDSGAVYVFVREGANWHEQAYLKASNPNSSDQFGRAVAISTNLLVVGAPYEDSKEDEIDGDQLDNSELNTGAAYFFRRTGSNWTQGSYLKAFNSDADDRYGFSVGISATNIVIGAPGESSSETGTRGLGLFNNKTNSGAVYVYQQAGTNWVFHDYLKASNTDAFDHFGSSVAIWEDVIVAGAPRESSAASNRPLTTGNQTDNHFYQAGAAYVFIKQEQGEELAWVQEAYVKPHDTAQFAKFGTAVSIHEGRLIVGAPLHRDNSMGLNCFDCAPEFHRFDQTGFAIEGLTRGAAYYYIRVHTNWIQQVYVQPSQQWNGFDFGRSVAAHADNILIGAPSDHSGARGVNGWEFDWTATNSGSATIYSVHPSVLRGPDIEVRRAHGKAIPHHSTVLDDENATYWGEVDINREIITRHYVITNHGDLDLRLYPARLVGPHANEFTIITNIQNLLVPLAGYTHFSIQFVAQGLGLREAEVRIPSNDPDIPEYTFRVAGEGYGNPEIRIWGNDQLIAHRDDTPSVAQGTDFEAHLVVGETRTNTFVITNYGNIDLELTSPRIHGPAATEFRLVKLPDPIVPPFETTTMQIVFDPAHRGVRQAEFEVGSNDASFERYQFSLEGLGLALPPFPEELQGYLKAFNTGAGDLLGASVAISGNVAVVGAVGESARFLGLAADGLDDSAPSSGAAYVFARNGSNWFQQAYLKAANADAFDFFGASVAVSDDVIVVGAPGEDGDGFNAGDNTTTNSGAAYVFVRNPESKVWSQAAYLKAANPAASSAFGHSVSVSKKTIVIGAPGEQTNSGAAYVFTRSSFGWALQQRIQPAGLAADDEFGAAVSIAGLRTAIGAAGTTDDTGAVHVYRQDGQAWELEATLTHQDAEADDRFGAAVGISGVTLAVGIPGEDSNAIGIDGDATDNSAPESGAVIVFGFDGTNWNQLAYLKPNNTDINDRFGSSIAVFGDLVAVGAPAEQGSDAGIGASPFADGFSDAGAVFLFERQRDVWEQAKYIKAPNVNPGDRFGHAVAIASASLLVGAPWEDGPSTGVDGDLTGNTATDAGAAYVYTLAAGLAAEPRIRVFGPALELLDGSANTSLATGTDFGVIPVALGSFTNQLRIFNLGALNLQLAVPSMVGDGALDFRLAADPPDFLAPGESTILTLVFDPAAVGTRNVHVTLDHNDPDRAPFDFIISGVGSGIPVMTGQPIDQLLEEGETLDLDVAVFGTELQHQWRRNGVALPNETGSRLLTTNLQTFHTGAYDLIVSNTFGAITSSVANVVIKPPNTLVRFVTQPASQSAPAGWFVTFSAQVRGEPPFSYQWHKDGAPLPDRTQSQLALFNLSAADAGDYTVRVTNPHHTYSSDAAHLTVQSLRPPVITQQPANTIAATGGSVSLQVIAQGTPMPTYTWVRDGAQVPNGDNATLTFNNVNLSHAGAYIVVVANSAGSVTSLPATITVIDPPTFLRQPTNTIVIVDQPATLSGNATGPAPIRYLWYRDGLAMTDETNSSLQFPAAHRGLAGTYRLSVSNPSRTILSSNAVLRVLVPQRILSPLAIPGGRLILRFQDYNGHSPTNLSSFEVQSATNLKTPNWIALTNALRYTNGMVELDTAIDQPRRFFRVLDR